MHCSLCFFEENVQCKEEQKTMRAVVISLFDMHYRFCVVFVGCCWCMSHVVFVVIVFWCGDYHFVSWLNCVLAVLTDNIILLGFAMGWGHTRSNTGFSQL